MKAADHAVESALDADLSTALEQARSACYDVLADYEHRSERLTWGVIGLAVLGAAAGGIAVPALSAASHAGNKVWIDALGGVSGVTNTAQISLASQGLTPAQALEARDRIRVNLMNALREFDDADGLPGQRKALRHILNACEYGEIPPPPSSCGRTLTLDSKGSATDLDAGCLEGSQPDCKDLQDSKAQVTCKVTGSILTMTGQARHPVLWKKK